MYIITHQLSELIIRNSRLLVITSFVIRKTYKYKIICIVCVYSILVVLLFNWMADIDTETLVILNGHFKEYV